MGTVLEDTAMGMDKTKNPREHLAMGGRQAMVAHMATIMLRWIAKNK